MGVEILCKKSCDTLGKTVANLNIDMIGRVDASHKDTVNYIYLIGADRISSELNTINKEVNEMYTNLLLDYTYDITDKNRYYYRSDHYNFAKNGVPVVFYFNGTHEDYHKETDDIEKINFDLLEKGHALFLPQPGSLQTGRNEL